MKLRSKTYSLDYAELRKALGLIGEVTNVELLGGKKLLVTHSFDDELKKKPIDEVLQDSDELIQQVDVILHDDWEWGIEFIPDYEEEK